MATNHYSNSPSFYDDIFRDTDYWDTYQGILQQYSNTPPDTWLGSITGKNSQRLYEHFQNRDAALNALLEQMRADEYNSTSSQVERDRAAGLNPDLLGANGGAESAPISSTGAPITQDDYASFISAISGFIGSVSNAALGVQSMVSQSLLNDGLRIENISKIRGQVVSDLASNPLLKDDFEYPSDITPAISLAYKTGNKRLDKKLNNMAKDLVNSDLVRAERAKISGDVASSRKNLFDVMSSPNYSDDDDTMKGVASRLAKMYGLIIDYQNEYNRSYFSSRDGSLQAGAENASDEYTSDFMQSLDGQVSAEAFNESNKSMKRADKLKNDLLNEQKGFLKWIRWRAEKLGDPEAIDILIRLSSGGGYQSSYDKLISAAGAVL